MTIRAAKGETFVGRAMVDERGVVWLIDTEGVRYQLAIVFAGRLAGRRHHSGGAGAARGARIREREGAVTRP